ncbi:hypothetical protein V493_02867 [Pseudogymnoascus sp. VKM F-4281 (FW-2241)]|nr:hypothetical protein V493_02867 [Pseudogymnoascus sp. VKM F-4281 (FW-2241)]
MEWPEFTNLYDGIKPPPGVYVPEREELLAGNFVAYDGLRQLGSVVQAPGVYYAFKEGTSTYILMEYIPGKTAEECLKEAQDEAQKESIYQSIGSALSELYRMPIPESRRQRPAAISSEKFRHNIFECYLQAPRHHESTKQFEDHINEFLWLAKRKEQLHDLDREPMVFCQSDIFHGNFMIDADNRVTAIDFADSSVVPSSLAKFSARFHNLGVDISQWVNVPSTEGIDNTQALLVAYGPMTIASGSFVRVGGRMPGGDEETQNRINQALQHEVRGYPRPFGPTLGEVIAAQKASGKLSEEGGGFKPHNIPSDTSASGYMASKPRILRKLRHELA